MKLQITNIQTGVYEIVESRESCRDDVDKSLWDMHANYPSRVWTCGKIVAERIREV